MSLAALQDRKAGAAVPAPPRQLFAVTVVLALAVGLINRSVAGWETPLWYDETTTAVIATQSDWRSLVAWLLIELSGPVYYTLLWGWEKLAGDTNVALRLPSFAFSIAAPLLILWKGHPDRSTRLIWAALASLWAPGFAAAAEARSHTLLFFLATAQAIAFLALLRAPGRGRAVLWLTISSLCVLTHYHAAVLAGLQGLLFLVWRGRAAWRCWPALLVLIPAIAWMAIHLPTVIGFATGGGIWQKQWPLSAAIYLPEIIFGDGWPARLLALTVLASLPVLALRNGWRFSTRDGDLALAIGALLAVALVFGLAFVRPSFTPRYLLSYVPGVLFALALWLRAAGRLTPLAPVAVIAMMIGLALGPLYHRLARPHQDMRYNFNFERASDWMRAEAKVERLVFLWDNSTRDTTPTPNLAEVGGFFLKRAGTSAVVEVVRPRPDRDPRPGLLAVANARPGTAILWAADLTVPNLMATHGLALDRLDPRWRCRDHGDRETVSIYACVRR